MALREIGHKLREFLQVAGMFALILGIICVPIGWGVNPKRDQSVFFNLADIGAFLRWAVVGIASGLILLLVSALLPRRPEQSDLLRYRK
jgi:hypothetical protein